MDQHFTLKKSGIMRNMILVMLLMLGYLGDIIAQTPTIQQYQVSRSKRTFDTSIVQTQSCFAVGSLTNGTSDDGRWIINLPWAFSFNGGLYTQVTVCTNGWLGFGSQATNTFTAGNAFNSTLPNIVAFPWMKDLNANLGSTIGGAACGLRAGDADTSGVFVVEWRNVAPTSGTSIVNTLRFQVWLFGPSSSHPGKIQFHYGPTSGTIATSSAIGIADSTSASGGWINMVAGGSFTATTTSSAYPGADSLYTFTPPPLTMGTMTAIQGNSTVSPGSADAPMLRITLPSTGIVGNHSLTRIRFNTNNTSNSDVITNGVKLWTGNATGPLTQIGSGLSIVGDSVSFTGLNVNLPSGTNYLWLTYSVSGSATLGNNLDASLPIGGISINNVNGSAAVGTAPGSALDPSGNCNISTPATYSTTVISHLGVSPRMMQSSTNNYLLSVKIVRSAAGAPINLTRVVLNSTGTTTVGNMTNVRLYNTGSSNTFATTTQFGSTIGTATATMVFTGTVSLTSDTTYLWATIDVASGATTGSTLDLGADSVYVAGTGYLLSPTTVSGNALAGPANLAYDITRATGVSYSSIQSTGEAFPSWINTSGDDNTTQSVTMPFNFSYAGINVTSYRVCTNGWMSLNGASVTSTSLSNNLNTNSSTLNTLLAPFWDDIVVPAQNFANIGAIKQKVDTISTSPLLRVLTVEWSGMERFNVASPNLNFQIKLYEGTNVIEFVYGNMSGFDGTTNVQWTYSMGINTWTPSTGLGANQIWSLQQPQTSVFSHLNTSTPLTWVPACYSKYTFTPGTYSAGANLAPVTNNECSGAQSLSISSSAPSEFCTTYRTGGATASSSIPSCSATTPGNPDDDVWFTFNNPITQDVTITCRGGGSFDPVVQVFSGSCGSLSAIACNNASTSSGSTEEFTLSSLSSGNYFIRVYHSGTGYSAVATDSGVFTLNLYSVPPPANDSIGGAILLTSNSTTCTPTSTQTTIAATASPEFNCGGTPSKDVWYYFQASSSGQIVTVTPVTPGTTFNPHVQVFALGSSFNIANATSGNSIACQNASAINTAEVVTLSGLTASHYYAIRVYHTLGGAGGTGNFNICVTIPPNAVGTITATQQGGIVAPGTSNSPIMLVQIPTSGGSGTLTLNSIRITASNTSNADIDTVKLWQTSGTSFTSPTLLGAQVLSGGQALFSSLSLSLAGGTNNFFVTYNVVSGATVNNNLDLNVASGDISISASGGATTPGTSPSLNPSGVAVIGVPLEFTVLRSTGVSYNSIMNTGNSYVFTGTNGDDQLSPTISIPFTFNYKGVNVNSMKASTNGWITLNPASITNTGISNSLTGNSTTINTVIAPHWEDLVCTGYSGTTPYTSSTQLDQSMKWKVDTVTVSPLRRVFVAEWMGMEKFNVPGPNLNFQVRMYETTNVIEFIYGNMSQFDGTSISEFSYSVGMNSFSTTTQGAGEFLALQETNTDIFASTAKDNHSWSQECYTRLRFTPGSLNTGSSYPAFTNDSAGSPTNLTVGSVPPTEFCAVFRTRGATPSPQTVPTGNADDDVWFSFTLATGRPVVIDLRSGPAFDGVFQLFNSSMTSLLFKNATGTSLTEDTTVNLSAGTYYVRVYHNGAGFATSATAFGNFGLFVYDAPVPPVNDWLSTASTLTPAANGTCVMSSTQSTLNATASGQLACTGTATKDIWYRFTAQIPVCTLTVTPVTPGTTFNPVVAVYDLGVSYDSTLFGTPVVCQNAGGANQTENLVLNSLVPGRQYAVRVYHNLGGAGGTGNFTICLRNTPGYWLGDVSTNWRTPANWSDNAIPTLSTRVNIGPGRPNYPILTAAENAKGLLVLAGGSITMNSGSRITIADTFKVNGTMTINSGSVVLNSAADSIPALTYHALTLAGTSGTYRLAGNATVNNVFNINNTGATLNLGTFNLTAKSDMTVNGTIAGTGKLIVNRTSGHSTLYGKGTFNNVDIDAGSGGGLRTRDTVQINGNLNLINGTMVISTGSRVFVGTTGTSTGLVTTAVGTTIFGNAGSHFGILGNGSSTPSSNVNMQLTGSFTLNSFNGMSLGSAATVRGQLNLLNGTINQNGYNLALGSTSGTTLVVTTASGKIKNAAATGTLSISGASGNPAASFRLDTVYNVTVNLPAGVNLDSSTVVNGSWSFFAGKVNLNGSTVVLGPNASLSEKPGSLFTGMLGSITTTRTIGSAISTLTNIGGLGLRMTTTSAPGTIRLTRKHDVLTNDGNSSIKRNYTLIMGSSTTAPFFEFTLDSTELNGNGYSTLRLNRKVNDTTWNKINYNSSLTGATGWLMAANQSLSDTIVVTASDSNYSLKPLFVGASNVAHSNMIGINSVYPNPFNEAFTIDLNAVHSGNAMVRITDINGKEVYRRSVSMQEGQNLFNISATDFSTGMYMVTIVNNEEIRTFRIVKQ